MRELNEYDERIKAHKEVLFTIHDDVLNAYNGFMKHRLGGKKPKMTSFNVMLNVLPLEYYDIWKSINTAREAYGSDLEHYLDFINREKSNVFKRIMGDTKSIWVLAKDYRDIRDSVK